MKTIQRIVTILAVAFLIGFDIWYFGILVLDVINWPGLCALHIIAGIITLVFFSSHVQNTQTQNSYFRLMGWTPEQIRDYLDDLESADKKSEWRPANWREWVGDKYLRLRGR